MPEIAEIARTVHFIRAHLVGRTIASVTAKEDDKVFGAVGTSAAEYEAKLTGRKIIGAGQQGKYFWLELDAPPHPLMHFGMTGWLHMRHVNTHYYAGKSEAPKEWPPKFWKFHFKTRPEGDLPALEVAYADSRRFGRCRLIECDAAEVRKVSPLKENGPDPVIDADVVTVEWLAEKLARRSPPIKAFLLDQANISGIGNWVGDDILYDAKIHPETQCNALSPEQVKRLHHSIHYICGTSCGLLGESEKFPKEWLIHSRQGKQLPDGTPITWLTVGGRSSAVITSVQKKTDGGTNGAASKPAKTTSKKAKAEGADEKPAKPTSKKVKAEADDEKPAKPEAQKTKKTATANGADADQPASKRRKVEPKAESTPKTSKPKVVKKEEKPAAEGRRRSQRLGKA